MVTKLAVLISGRGSNAMAVAEECLNGNIDAEVVCLGSDNPDASGLEFARENNIDSFVVDYKKIISEYMNDSSSFVLPGDFQYKDIESKTSFFPIKDREKYLKTRARAEGELLDLLMPHKPDLLVLAGFMRTFTPYFIDRFSPDSLNPRIMNIHPAILPSFPGVDGYGDTFFYGCKVGGCTVHFVDYGTDSGPVIIQKCFDILPEDGLEDIKKKGLELEWRAFPEAVKLFADKRLKVKEHTRSSKNGEEKRRIVEII